MIVFGHYYFNYFKKKDLFKQKISRSSGKSMMKFNVKTSFIHETALLYSFDSFISKTSSYSLKLNSSTITTRT